MNGTPCTNTLHFLSSWANNNGGGVGGRGAPGMVPRDGRPVVLPFHSGGHPRGWGRVAGVAGVTRGKTKKNKKTKKNLSSEGKMLMDFQKPGLHPDVPFRAAAGGGAGDDPGRWWTREMGYRAGTLTLFFFSFLPPPPPLPPKPLRLPFLWPLLARSRMFIFKNLQNAFG